MLNKQRWLSILLISLCLILNSGCDQKNNQTAQPKQSQQHYSKADKAALEAEPFKYLNISCEQVVARLTQKGLGKDKAEFYMGEEFVVGSKPRMKCMLLYNKEALQLHGLTAISLNGNYKSTANLTEIHFIFDTKDRNHPVIQIIIKEMLDTVGISMSDIEKITQEMQTPEDEKTKKEFAYIMEINGYKISYVPLGSGFIITKL